MRVRNARGDGDKIDDEWFLSGDTSLEQSNKTLRIGRAAVAQTRENIEWARRVYETHRNVPGGKTCAEAVASGESERIKLVTDYVPQPFASTRILIRQIEESIGNPNDNQGVKGKTNRSVAANVAVTRENLSTMIDSLKSVKTPVGHLALIQEKKP